MSDFEQPSTKPREGTRDYFEQIAAEKVAQAKLSPPPPQEVDARSQEALHKEAEAAREVGFAARLLVQATLPHSKPASGVNEFERSNGHVRMKIIGDPAYGLPYGTYPRLLLAWITSEAVRTKSRHLELGSSLRDFMSKLDIGIGGGPRGAAPRLRDHMRRLFTSTVSANYERNGEWHNAGFRPIERANLFWDPKQPEQVTLWQSGISLNQLFFEEITQKPVPVDMHALRLLAKSRSPLAIDIYQWLTHRFSYLHEPVTIPWRALQLQFGGDYGRVRKFREKFKAHLEEVIQLYPQANVDFSARGLSLRPSKTHIPMRLIRTKKP